MEEEVRETLDDVCYLVWGHDEDPVTQELQLEEGAHVEMSWHPDLSERVAGDKIDPVHSSDTGEKVRRETHGLHLENNSEVLQIFFQLFLVSQ